MVAARLNRCTAYIHPEVGQKWSGFSKATVIAYIDDARTHADLRGPGNHINPPEIHRMRLETTKTDHFLEFISRSSLLQYVSYGKDNHVG